MRMKPGQSHVACEKCGSNAVQPMPMVAVFMGGAGCLLLVPVIGWIIAPFFFLAGIVVACRGGKYFRCKGCNHMTRVSKETHKRYKEYGDARGEGEE